MSILFIVDTSPPSGWVGYESISDPNPLVVLLRSTDGLAATVKHELSLAGVAPRISTAAGELDRIALAYRDEYARMVAEAPGHLFDGGPHGSSAPIFEDRLALWWLDEVSTKRSDARLTYSRFCQVQLIRETIRVAQITDLRVATSDVAFWESLRSLAGLVGIMISTPRPEGRLLTRLKLSYAVLRILLANLAWFARTALQTAVARILLRKPAAREGRCALYTQFPDLWKRTGKDEKYEGVPNLLSEMPGLDPVFACSFATDGQHQGAPLLKYAGRCRWANAYNRTASVQLYLMDRELRLSDYVRSFWAGGVTIRYVRTLLHARFKKAWTFEGVDLSSLFMSEFRLGMLTIPRHVLAALRVRRFVRLTRPACFVHYLFEFGYGRAMAYGARTADPDLPIVGVQQGPITRRQLQYHRAPGELELGSRDFLRHPPTPDGLIVESEAARVILAEAGFDDHRIRVGGAPRLGALAEASVGGRIVETGRRRPTVLFVFSPHDGAAMVAAALPAAVRLPQSHFVFKLHPRGTFSEATLRRSLRRLQCPATFEIATGSVYDVLARSDVVVTTYSSVGIEAATLGIPLVCLHLPDRVNVGQLLDLDSGTIPFVSDTDALVAALMACTTTEQNPERRDRLDYVMGAYGPEAEMRWAALIHEAGAVQGESWLSS